MAARFPGAAMAKTRAVTRSLSPASPLQPGHLGQDGGVAEDAVAQAFQLEFLVRAMDAVIIQAEKFGASLTAPCTVASLASRGGYLVARLSDGSDVAGRAIIAAVPLARGRSKRPPQYRYLTYQLLTK